MKWVSLDFLGKRIRVPALKAQGKLWVHWQGETHVIDQQAGQRRSGGEKAKADPSVTTAPMPGKITRVSVKAGDLVTKGKPLIMMEAMKMEYTLEAAQEGKVKEVNVSEGQQVKLGEVLVRLEGSGGEA